LSISRRIASFSVINQEKQEGINYCPVMVNPKSTEDKYYSCKEKDDSSTGVTIGCYLHRKSTVFLILLQKIYLQYYIQSIKQDKWNWLAKKATNDF